jgi:hypothetical protein
MHVTGPTAQDDLVAAWIDAPYLGQTGRIGRIVDAATAARCARSCQRSGVTAYTDGDGAFRLDGPSQAARWSPTPPTRLSPSSGRRSSPQRHPAELALVAAPRIDIAFEVTLPEGTPADAPIRVAGNVRSFGAVFAELPGGVSTTAARMPVMVRVDATHALLLTQLHAGTDLRYKYTLGDGLWNAERDANGGFVTRQLIVPEQGPIVQDTSPRGARRPTPG